MCQGVSNTMPKLINKILYPLPVLGFFLLSSLSAFAQIKPVTGSGLGIPDKGTLTEFIVNIINAGLALIGLAAAIYIIISGIRYISSSGDDGDAKKAKNGILYAVIGLVVIGLAAMIVNFVIATFI